MISKQFQSALLFFFFKRLEVAIDDCNTEQYSRAYNY
jgi:hypothetical protein